MIYVEYSCVPGTSTSPGYLYRNEVSVAAHCWLEALRERRVVLLNNLLANPSSALPAFPTKLPRANPATPTSSTSRLPRPCRLNSKTP